MQVAETMAQLQKTSGVPSTRDLTSIPEMTAMKIKYVFSGTHRSSFTSLDVLKDTSFKSLVNANSLIEMNSTVTVTALSINQWLAHHKIKKRNFEANI